MSKLYIFGIGGTGCRVIRSMMMLAASGVKFNADSIVPIIIDTDIDNEDLTRTITLINNYTEVRKYLKFDKGVHANHFFETHIEDKMDGYRLNIENTRDVKFRRYIGYDSMKKENKALASILFSEDNLNADMKVGFTGNPNIGSVVLNQFESSPDFNKFASTFQNGDRIFIISSIFGGTGASGFPLLVKTFRSCNKVPKKNIQNAAGISEAPIGALTVMPYFRVKPKADSRINSDTFIGKTKAALHYYKNNVYGKLPGVNVLYSIGDTINNQYENHEGSEEQKNDAHFVEFASALAIADFLRYDSNSEEMQVSDDPQYHAKNVVFKEFGIEGGDDKNNVRNVLFQHLSSITKNQVMKEMTQFVLFAHYVKSHLKEALVQPWAKDNKIDAAFLNKDFISGVTNCADQYLKWLDEMSRNVRGFSPYEQKIEERNLYEIVNGVKPGSIKALWAFGKKGYDLFDAALNNEQKDLSKSFKEEQKFADMFYEASRKIVEGKYKF